MSEKELYSLLETASVKPEVFSSYTADKLWTDDHISEQMLQYHLNPDVDVSSRRQQFIDESVAWMLERFNLSQQSHIIDFGCGPGLYTSRLARDGANVTGIDFSKRSLQYARSFAAEHQLSVNYVEGNYLEAEIEGQFDLITMIMCDFCALSPAQRGQLLHRFKQLLAPQGRVLLDVYAYPAFDEKETGTVWEKNQMNGFWARDPYHALLASFKYDDEKVSLDKYTIVNADRIWAVYNWLQYFSTDSLRQELNKHQLEVEEYLGNVAGDAFDEDQPEFAVIIKPV